MDNLSLPVGTKDQFGAEAQLQDYVTSQLSDLFNHRGYEKLKTPVVEFASVFEPLQADNYRPYQMLDDRGRTLVLRPDLTLPVARVMSATGIEPPVKWYYTGDVFRLKKELSGSYNQETQAGVEIIGYPDFKAELECLMIALKGCQALNISGVTVQLGDAKFIDSLLTKLPLTDPSKQELRSALFEKNLSKYDKLIETMVDSKFSQFLKEWPWMFGTFSEVMTKLESLVSIPEIYEMLQRFRVAADFISDNFPKVEITLDLSMKSPQNYYTGLIFQGFSNSSSEYLFSGGRYDDLLKNFQQNQISAVGLAFNVDGLSRHLLDKKTVAKRLLFFNSDQWQEAEKLVLENQDLTMCLATDIEEARRIADSKGVELVDISQGGKPNE